MIAGAGDDTLEGDRTANILSGGTGADSLIAVAGDDTLIGGLGADSLVGGTGNDVFQGTAAELDTDYIFDFGPADRLDITDLQSNSILTLSGDGRVDIDLNGDGVVDSTLHVFAQTGGFLVVDDLGEIAYQADLPDEPAPPAPSPAPDNTQSGPEGLGVQGVGAGVDTQIETESDLTAFDGGLGIDTVYTSVSLGALPSNVENVVTTGDQPTSAFLNELDNLAIGNEGVNLFYGLEGTDTLFGGLSNDWVYGNQDNDIIYGNEGFDTLYGGQNDDHIYGGQQSDISYGNLGLDVVYGNLGDDVVYGGRNVDTIFGGRNDDVVFGNKGNDLLFGNKNNDTLYGGEGDDTLSGGEGVDRFVFEVDSGTDILTDFDIDAGEVLDFRLLNLNLEFDDFRIFHMTETANGNVQLDFGDGNVLTLLGVRLDDLQASHFDLI